MQLARAKTSARAEDDDDDEDEIRLQLTSLKAQLSVEMGHLRSGYEERAQHRISRVLLARCRTHVDFARRERNELQALVGVASGQMQRLSILLAQLDQGESLLRIFYCFSLFLKIFLLQSAPRCVTWPICWTRFKVSLKTRMRQTTRVCNTGRRSRKSKLTRRMLLVQRWRVSAIRTGLSDCARRGRSERSKSGLIQNWMPLLCRSCSNGIHCR